MSKRNRKPKKSAESRKISKLVRDEKMPQDQAVAVALNMKREGRLTPSGGYRRASRKPKRKGARR